MSNDTLEFLASIPGTQTAIQVHGSGGMRIVLDIPDKEVGNAIKIMMMTKHVLKVTIEKLPHETYGRGSEPVKKNDDWLKPTGKPTD
jgi:hypothetical protein